MKEFIDNLASFTGPGAVITAFAIWIYVGSKKQKYFTYMVNAHVLFSEYKELTRKQNGRVGILYYLFIFLIILTFISVLNSAV